MSAAPQRCDIAIIGGGLAGASLALILAQALPGVQLTLVESQAFANPNDALLQPSFDGRSTALAPSSVAVFQALGLWEALAAYATAIESIHVSDAGHWGLSQFERADNAGEPLGYVVENAGFGRVLLPALQAHPNIQVLAPDVVQQLVPVAGGTRLVLAQGELIASLTLIADGADSPLRRQLGIGVREQSYHQQALVANVAFSQPHGARAYERFTAEGPLALLPLGRRASACTSALVWTFPEQAIDAAMAMPDAELLALLQTTFGFRLGRFTRIGQRAAYPLRLVVAEEQVRSGLVLLGNAAHFLHPVAGQGFNLSLRDGLRLAEVLAAGHAQGVALGDLALLQTYQQAQQPDQDQTIFLSHSFSQVFSRQGQHWRWGRDLAMLSLEFHPLLRSRFIQQLAGKSGPAARPWGAYGR